MLVLQLHGAEFSSSPELACKHILPEGNRIYLIPQLTWADDLAHESMSEILISRTVSHQDVADKLLINGHLKKVFTGSDYQENSGQNKKITPHICENSPDQKD